MEIRSGIFLILPVFFYSTKKTADEDLGILNPARVSLINRREAVPHEEEQKMPW